MDSEKWKRVDNLFQAALERSPEERDTFLRQACGDDVELQREVESLLTEAATTDHGLLDRPVASLLAEAPTIMLQTGSSLGPYQIEGLIGQGGMGKVYRALDTRLGRTVAIKTSNARFSERFDREARAVAALNHPHICQLYDVGPDYLVMEYIEGTALVSPAKPGPLPVEQVLDYAEQICDALDAAHSSGIVHRDLKPGNILVSKRGIKLLDFGLASVEPSPGDSVPMASGPLMGTPAYMAPEQWEGKRADARSDIYAFGCVLHEMLTGKRAISGRMASNAALANRSGANSSNAKPRGPGPSPELERIVSKCLEQEAGLRYQHVAEIRAELRRLRRDTDSARLGDSKIPRPKARWKAIVPAGAILVAALILGSFYFPRALHGAARLTDHDTIIVADFVNTTGDPAFDGILREGLIVQLQQSPFLSLVADQKIRATLPLMGKPADAALTVDTAREVCVRAGARAMLTGSIATLGTRYVLNLRGEGCANGDALDNEQADAPGKDQVLKTLSEMASRFRSRVGESLAMVREHNVPLEEATTPSLEALKAFTAGVDLAGTRSDEGSALYRRAVELDPQFAAAWSFLAINYSNLGETSLARESAIRAYQARDHASGPEKFNIEYSYHRNVTGNLEKAWSSVSLWRATYPRDNKAFGLSGGYAANGTGRFEAALAATEQAIRMAQQPVHYGNKARILFQLSPFGEAEKALLEAIARRGDAGLFLLQYRLALMKQDGAAAERAVAESRGHSEDEMLMWHAQALVAAGEGRLEEAQRDSRRAIEMARDAGFTERAAVFEAAQAVWNAFYGNKEAARQKAEAALKAFDGREVEYAAGFALGLAGAGARAEALAAKLNRDHPEDTQVQATYVPALRALAAMAENDPAKAIELLEENRRYEFAIPPLAFNHYYGNMYPIYVRGLAYLSMHRKDEAAAEFSRLLAHPGLSAGDPVDAMARRQLAGARALAPAAEKH